MMFGQTSFGKSRRFEGILREIWKGWRLFLLLEDRRCRALIHPLE